jgi:hypothetical protein
MRYMENVQYTAMIDSDDFYKPGYLEHLAHALDESPGMYVAKLEHFTQIFVRKEGGEAVDVMYGTQPVKPNLHYGGLFFLRRSMLWDSAQNIPLAQYMTLTISGIDEIGFAHHVHRLEELKIFEKDMQMVVPLGADYFVRIKLYSDPIDFAARADKMIANRLCLSKTAIQKYWNVNMEHDDLLQYETIKGITDAIENKCNRID